MSELGHLPRVGDVVEAAGGAFRVERLEGRRIDRIRYTPTVVDETAAEAPAVPTRQEAGR
jgi:CBS domain containing-hemolysin-like protein